MQAPNQTAPKRRIKPLSAVLKAVVLLAACITFAALLF